MFSSTLNETDMRMINQLAKKDLPNLIDVSKGIVRNTQSYKSRFRYMGSAKFNK